LIFVWKGQRLVGKERGETFFTFCLKSEISSFHLSSWIMSHTPRLLILRELHSPNREGSSYLQFSYDRSKGETKVMKRTLSCISIISERENAGRDWRNSLSFLFLTLIYALSPLMVLSRVFSLRVVEIQYRSGERDNYSKKNKMERRGITDRVFVPSFLTLGR